MKKIHFVCTGNVYRSRIAEAYMNSMELYGIEFSSSGIEAKNDEDGPIAWYAQRILKRRGLVQFMKEKWHQTSKEILMKQDYVVFMEQKHLEYCREVYGFSGKNYEVWNISDVYENTETYGDWEREREYTLRIIEASETTADSIKDKATNLQSRLERLLKMSIG